MSRKTSRRDFLKASALISAGTLLAACAPQATPQPQAASNTKPTNPPAQTKKKVVFSTYTWSSFETAMGGILDDWAKSNSDIVLDKQFVPQTEDYYAKIQTMIAAGTPPDVGISDYGHLVSYAKAGTILDVTNYITTNTFPMSAMIPGAVDQYRWNPGDFDSGGNGGKMFGLPSDAQGQIFVYNKKMFDEAGVKYPTDDWTWDDVLSAAKAITKADQNKWGILFVPTYILMKGNFVFSAGGAIHSPDFTKSMLDAPETLEAYKWNWDLIYTHKVSPTPGGVSGQNNPFMTGQVAMYVEGVWWITDFVNGIKDFDWDVALLPKHPKTGKRTVSVESDGWWIFKGAKEPDAAWRLLSFLAGQDGQKKLGDVGFVIPSCFPDVAKQWYGQTPPANRMKVFDNIQTDSHKVDVTYFEYGTISTAVNPVIDKAFTDGDDIVKAMTDAAKVYNEELDKAWKLYKS